MRTRGRIILATAAIVALGILLSFRALEGRQKTQARLADELARQVKLCEDFASVNRTARTLNEKIDEVRESIAALPVMSEKPPLGPARNPLMQDLDENPELARLWTQRQRAGTNSEYGALFVRLGFSAKEKADFIELCTQAYGRMDDLSAVVNARELSWDDPVVQYLRDDEKAQYRAELEARFGKPRADQVIEFERKIPPRHFADSLAATLAFIAPLKLEQAETITQIIADATPAYANGGVALNQAIDWATVDAKVQSVLSPEQYAVWKEDNLGALGFSDRDERILDDLYRKVIAVEKQKAEAAQAEVAE